MSTSLAGFPNKFCIHIIVEPVALLSDVRFHSFFPSMSSELYYSRSLLFSAALPTTECKNAIAIAFD